MGLCCTKRDKVLLSSSSQASPPSSIGSSHGEISSRRVGSILSNPISDVTSFFTLKKELGRGHFGVTYLCIEKSTRLKFACKSVSKLKLTTKRDIEAVRREILILQHLSGQPNIVKFKGAYEDCRYVHLVMELCSGGQLFDRIIAKRNYPERAAAAIGRAIVNVVHACHFMGVMHRDLKPENFLFVSKEEDSPLKAIDFGLSVFIEEGKVYHDVVGSAYYVAPEVLRQNYGKEIDVWSAGVIIYLLLSGVPPFCAETEAGIFSAILRGEIDFKSEPWPSVSDAAKDLIKKMLTQDPKNRITAAQVLGEYNNLFQESSIFILCFCKFIFSAHCQDRFYQCHNFCYCPKHTLAVLFQAIHDFFASVFVIFVIAHRESRQQILVLLLGLIAFVGSLGQESL